LLDIQKRTINQSGLFLNELQSELVMKWPSNIPSNPRVFQMHAGNKGSIILPFDTMNAEVFSQQIT
jgi:hypothetical protein